MKKVLSILNMVALLTFLMGVGLVLYLVGTGRLDKEKSQTILDLVRHHGSPIGLREQVFTVIEPPTTAPSTAPAATQTATPDTGDGQAFASAADRIAYTRQAMEEERLRLEHDAQELQHRQQLLDQKRAEIDSKLAELNAQKKIFDSQVATTQSQNRTEAFNKSLDLYNELKPKQVKDLFMALTPDAAASFLVAMDTSQAAKIIAEFKSPDEKTYISTVLEKIRTPANPLGMPSASDQPTTAPADSIAGKAP